jgi:hypothetical protein
MKYHCKTYFRIVYLPHTLEVSPVSLLSPHHDPHGAPLRDVQRLHDPRYLIHKTDRSSYVVQNFYIPYLESGVDLKKEKKSLLHNGFRR